MLSSNLLLKPGGKLVRMSEKSLNHVFADNLAELMHPKGLNTVSLAKASSVSQKSISNYLNPDNRSPGSTGKQPSAKLTELDMVAKALDVEPWKLLRPLAPDERRAYEQIEIAFKALQGPGLVSIPKPKPMPKTKLAA
jgi:transcriptional regulator with XRE-family HTH domain